MTMAETKTGALMIQKMGNIIVVEFLQTSIVDQSQIERIKQEILEQVEKAGHPKLVVSFAGVTNISSAMIGVMMALHKKVKEMGGEMRVAAANKHIMQVFKLTRLDKVFAFYKTLDQAMQKIAD
jgi:anti-sigma B factor antagonist